jgi:hypothetical protein
MMTMMSPPPTPGLVDAGLAVARLVEHGRLREAEVATAFLALWLLDRVERGATDREQANAIFAELDANVRVDQEGPLSDTWRELVTEAEHFHHFGEEWGANPAELRRLANLIIAATSTKG